MNRPDATAKLIFSGQLTALRDRIESANSPGNLEGLFARHVLGDHVQIQWRVDPVLPRWLEQNPHLREAPTGLAVLGFAVTARPTLVAATSDVLVAGLHRLMERNPYPPDRMTFVYHAAGLVGVHLAGRAIQERLPEFLPWLEGVLDDARRDPGDPWLELMHEHVLAELRGKPADISDLARKSGDALAAVHYLLATGTATTNQTAEHLGRFQERAVHAFLRTDPIGLDIRKAALWLRLGEDVATANVDQLTVSTAQVSRVLSRFEAALHRWRWDSDDLQDPIRWRIGHEREVQDILWIMLRPVFEDLVAEDTLPRVGHSSYRADLGLPRLGLLIEVKYVRSPGDFKKIEQEVMVDVVAYLQKTDRYREMIVFVYDESSSVEHHDLTINELRQVPGIADVIIVCRPGVLTSADGTRGRTRPKRKRSKPAAPGAPDGA